MNERLKRSLLPGHHPLLPDHLGEEDARRTWKNISSSQEAVQSLSGGNPGWRVPSSTSEEDQKRIEAIIRPNVQEIVGTAYARYFLGNGNTAGMVDWISEAISAKLATDPAFFWGGRE